MKNAYWMRYPSNNDQGGYIHVAVVAESLDEAFEKLSLEQKIDQKKIAFRNRELNVLV